MFFILVLIIIVFLYINKNKDIKQKKSIKKIDLVNILSKKINDEEINKDFLSWVDNNYKDSLSKLNKSLENNEYNSKMWHDVTGNSWPIYRLSSGSTG